MEELHLGLITIEQRKYEETGSTILHIFPETESFVPVVAGNEVWMKAKNPIASAIYFLEQQIGIEGEITIKTAYYAGKI